MDIFGDGNVATFITMALTVATMVFGGLWMQLKGKLNEIRHFANVLVDSLEDNTITPEEVNGIKNAFKAIIGKE
jgi:hypothetical protein